MHLKEDVFIEAQTKEYTCNIKVREHKFISDEPFEKGGMNKGPSPFELLLSSLGSCTAITLRMYANRKNWDLQKITISLNLDKVIENGVLVSKIYQKVYISGDLDNVQRKRLMEIADKCPVHLALESPIEIFSSMEK
jgi:putative redox protein